MSEEILGWWFAASDELPHGDRRKVVIGEMLRVEPPIVPCHHGLHASVDPFDALQYAPGPLLYRVRLSGIIVAHGGDKHAASERTALACRDATDMLRLFARRRALSVIHLWKAPTIVREYLETGDESKRDAAWAAARAAARAAASAAAEYAAGDAARAAARAAASAAASAIAGDAAWVAGAAASAIAGDAAWDAAWAAAGAVARDAAGDAARKEWGEMVAELFKVG